MKVEVSDCMNILVFGVSVFAATLYARHDEASISQLQSSLN